MIGAAVPNKIITRYVPDLIGSVVTAAFDALNMEGFYDYGHYAEVTKQLTIKDQGISDAVRTKYPLVWLVMDFAEDYGRALDVYCEVNCQLIIANATDMNYTMAERRDENFLPILYPIYSELLYQFSQSPTFRRPPAQTIQHTKIDRPYWDGKENGAGGQNLFNDFIDAIQIKNLKLSVAKLIC
jgi:hypothetical protein